MRVWRDGFLLEEHNCLSFNCGRMNMMWYVCVQVLGIGPMRVFGDGGGVSGNKPSPTDSWYSGPGGRETRALLCDSILGAAMAPVVVF